MKRMICCAALLTFALGLGLVAEPASALPIECSIQCQQPYTPDYVVCTSYGWSRPLVITCGEYRNGDWFLTGSGLELGFAEFLAVSRPEASSTAASQTPSPAEDLTSD